MNANFKQLKNGLVLGVKKLGPLFLALKLDKFQLFDNIFDFLSLDLNDFWNLANFLLFNFCDLLMCSTPLLPNPSTSPLPLFFPKYCLLLSIILEFDLLLFFLLVAGLSDNLIIFNIEVNEAAILF